MSKTPEKSNGHIGFSPSSNPAVYFEYFERNDEIFRANHLMPVMDDGYRVGRWECMGDSELADHIRLEWGADAKVVSTA